MPIASRPCTRAAERLLVAVGDAAAVEVVRREFDLHPVTGQDADVMAAHLARDVPEHLMLVVELDAEHGVRKGLGDLALHLDLFFFAHALRVPISVLRTWPCRARHAGRTPPPAAGPRSG